MHLKNSWGKNMDAIDSVNEGIQPLRAAALDEFVISVFGKVDKDKSQTLDYDELRIAAESRNLTKEENVVSRVLLETFDAVSHLQAPYYDGQIARGDLDCLSQALKLSTNEQRLTQLNYYLEKRIVQSASDGRIGASLGAGVSTGLIAGLLGFNPLLIAPIGAAMGYFGTDPRLSSGCNARYERSEHIPSFRKLVHYFK